MSGPLNPFEGGIFPLRHAAMGRLKRSSLTLIIALCIHGAAMAEPNTLQVDLTRLLKEIPEEKVNSQSRQAMRQALVLVGEDRLDEGSQRLNAALKLDPSNSYLQFFNAFAYHQMGRRGDAQKFVLAEQGYLLAVQFDASNWIAHYFLGTMYFEQRNFKAAQQEWAAVLLSLGEDQEVLLRIVAAAYYAGDPVTAAACLERLRVLSPADPQILQLSSLVSAAINQPQKAEQWLTLYQNTQPTVSSLARLRQRVDHWAVVHRNSKKNDVPSIVFAQDGALEETRQTQGNSIIRTQGQQWGGSVSQEGGFPVEGGQGQGGFGSQSSQGGFPGSAGQGGNPNQGVMSQDEANARRMVLVDVVIMRTEDSLNTRKGVNLLTALTLQFGGVGLPGFSKTFSSSDSIQSGFGTSNTTTTALTRAISLPALTYSLNIVNSNANLNEVLARPTLAALNGVKSEFFSGTTLNAAVVSSGSLGGNAVTIEKEIGVKLSILPTFLSGNKIRLTVDAQRTFLKPPSSDVSYTYKLETSKIMVNANVVMDFGETLVLGGLSEKETSNTRDGVPVLQDIPGVQYIFSRKDTNDFQRSVLMLITPREPQYTYRKDMSPASADAASASGLGSEGSMKELRARYGDWFKPYPNLASVFSQLNSSSIYREFRTGDVTLEKWDKQSSTVDRLKQALDFLFY
jgi:tetratricopeptide (TPR) repeat protein